ncbi:hypothetical protein [Bacillus sp. CH30_1T]|nr:hypothetical protein [Bacillus sp. CH30_1T]
MPEEDSKRLSKISLSPLREAGGIRERFEGLSFEPFLMAFILYVKIILV